MATSQDSDARSALATVFVLPIANGLMHIPPAIGAIWTALGRRDVLDVPGLLLLFAIHVLIDVADKYVDLPPATRQKWSSSTGVFAGFFVLLVAYMTYLCGLWMLGQLLLVPALVIVHATPLIPYWSFGNGRVQFTNLKSVLGIFKSLFGAFCIALMDTRPIVQHACTSQPGSCDNELSRTRQLQAFAFTMLYDFVLETVFDLRDIEEDSRNGIRTLPVALGRELTLLLLASVTVPGELLIKQKFGMAALAESLLRVALTLEFLAYVVNTRPRGDTVIWGLLTLVGLLPAFWAQTGLL